MARGRIGFSEAAQESQGEAVGARATLPDSNVPLPRRMASGVTSALGTES